MKKSFFLVFFIFSLLIISICHAENLITSYGIENYDNDQNLSISTSLYGEAIYLNGSDLNITQVSFYLRKYASPNANISIRVYDMDILLGKENYTVRSDFYNVSDLTTTFQIINFTFSEKITLDGNRTYCFILVFEDVITLSGNHYIKIGRDGSSPSYNRHMIYLTTALNFYTNYDWIFYVYGEPIILDTTGYTEYNLSEYFILGATMIFILTIPLIIIINKKKK